MSLMGRLVRATFGPVLYPNRPIKRITFGTLAHLSIRRIFDLSAPAKLLISPSFSWREVDMAIRIFLIDEHRPARNILARRLASMPGLDVVGSSCNGEEAVREIQELSPDVVLIDTKMKRADGIDICRRAMAAVERTTVAILTSYLDPNERCLAYEAGVNAYLLKDVDTGNLADWIKLAAAKPTNRDSGDSDESSGGREDQAQF